MNSGDISEFFVRLAQMNFGPYISMVAPTIIYYAVREPIKVNYQLKKDAKLSGARTASLPPKVIRKYDDIKEELILEKLYGKSVINFLNVVQNNIPEINPAILINNLNTLQIKNKDFRVVNLITNSSTAGQYLPNENFIELTDSNHLLTINHELFHTISTIKNDDTGMIYSGFSQTTKNNEKLGEGLNEGYTQYLTDKYFGQENTLKNAYVYEKRIAEALEIIIGKEKMQSLYFNANLNGLIEYMKKYTTEEDIYGFINKLDFLNTHLYDKHLTPSSKDILVNYLKDVNSFLVRLALKKKVTKLRGKSFVPLDVIKSISDIITLIPVKVKANRNYFIASDEAQLMKDFDSVFFQYELENPKKATR